MTNNEITEQVASVRAKLETALAAGDRESIMRSIALLNKTSGVVVTKDFGIFAVRAFQNIWIEEEAQGEPSIFAGVGSLAEVLDKFRVIRHSFFRLENDFPDDLCMEAMQALFALNLSNTAFRILLNQIVENPDAVYTRINEIAG
jgi:hypothetical protein